MLRQVLLPGHLPQRWLFLFLPVAGQLAHLSSLQAQAIQFNAPAYFVRAYGADALSNAGPNLFLCRVVHCDTLLGVAASPSLGDITQHYFVVNEVWQVDTSPRIMVVQPNWLATGIAGGNPACAFPAHRLHALTAYERFQMFGSIVYVGGQGCYAGPSRTAGLVARLNMATHSLDWIRLVSDTNTPWGHTIRDLVYHEGGFDRIVASLCSGACNVIFALNGQGTQIPWALRWHQVDWQAIATDDSTYVFIAGTRRYTRDTLYVCLIDVWSGNPLYCNKIFTTTDSTMLVPLAAALSNHAAYVAGYVNDPWQPHTKGFILRLNPYGKPATIHWITVLDSFAQLGRGTIENFGNYVVAIAGITKQQKVGYVYLDAQTGKGITTDCYSQPFWLVEPYPYQPDSVQLLLLDYSPYVSVDSYLFRHAPMPTHMDTLCASCPYYLFLDASIITDSTHSSDSAHAFVGDTVLVTVFSPPDCDTCTIYWGDGTITSCQHNMHVYTQPGYYVIGVSCRDTACGLVGSDTLHIWVDIPSAIPNTPSTGANLVYWQLRQNQIVIWAMHEPLKRAWLQTLDGRMLAIAMSSGYQSTTMILPVPEQPGIYFLIAETVSGQRAILRFFYDPAD